MACEFSLNPKIETMSDEEDYSSSDDEDYVPSGEIFRVIYTVKYFYFTYCISFWLYPCMFTWHNKAC